MKNSMQDTANKSSLIKSNLPEKLADMRGKFDYDVLSAKTTMDRFLASVNELPEEVTVLDPIELEDYPCSAEKKQLYVSSAKGDDSNSGTKDAPYKTIGKALSEMENQGGGVIWVEGGDYPITESIALNKSNCGTEKSPLFIKSYGDGKVTLTSNVVIDGKGLRPVDVENDKVAARLHDSVKDKVYYVNLYDLGWSESDIAEITTKGAPTVYVDGEPFTLAQYPNAFYDDGKTRLHISDLLYFKHVYDSGSVTNSDGNLYWPWIERATKDPNLTPDSVVGWEFRILNEQDGLADEGDGAMGDEILSWVNTGDVWCYGSTFEGWEHGYYQIDPTCVHDGNLLGRPKEDGFYSLKSVHANPFGCKRSGNSAAGRNTFYLFNAIEALDAPGEWFIDRKTGNFYIYPKFDDITKQKIAYSGGREFNLVDMDGASYVVLDGIGADGSLGHAVYTSESNNIVIQHADIKNTKMGSVKFEISNNCALIYSNIAHSSTYMVIIKDNEAEYSLTPSNIFVQNNTFSDTPSTVAYAMSVGGCRVVVSHNHFIDCCLRGSGTEHIIEYNRFEGGNKFVTDGGMIYFNAYHAKGIHARYNLCHMFHATHNAIYFDTMGSGMYAYKNMISTLGGQSNAHKAWYSSTGHENVCFGNIIVLRNAVQIDTIKGRDTDEGTEAIRKGDQVNESGLFYYYYGDNAQGNSLAGHWWKVHKGREINKRLLGDNVDAWFARYPEYMNFLRGTQAIMEAYNTYDDYMVYYDTRKLSDKTHVFKTSDDTVIWVPPFEYLDENGETKVKPERVLRAEDGQITLTFDELVAMERVRRQPAFSVIDNNVILGGSSEPSFVITNGAESYTGLIKDVTSKENNYLEFDYNKILEDADNHNYKISEKTWAMLEEKMGKEFVTVLKDVDYEKAGLSK